MSEAATNGRAKATAAATAIANAAHETWLLKKFCGSGPFLNFYFY